MAWSEESASFLIVLTAMTLYFNSLQCGYVFDDLPAIQNNQDLQNNVPLTNLLWNDYWGTPMSQEKSHKSYRPLTVLTFRLNNVLFGKDAWHYHALNAILHSVVTALYLKFCLVLCKLCSRHATHKSQQSTVRNGVVKPQATALLRLYDTNYKVLKKIAYIAAALFAVHPIHCEAVTGLVGRAELLSAVFMLLVLLCYAKSGFVSMALSLGFCVCAVASKEQGITVIAICMVFDFFVLHKLTPIEFLLCKKSSNIYTALRTSVLCLVGFCVLWWRINIMGGNLPSFTPFDNPAAVSLTPTRQFTYNYILAVNFQLLLSPVMLLCDWTMGTVPLITKLTDVRNLATIGLWCGLFGTAWIAASRRDPRSKLTMIGLSLLLFPFLPASNLFFPVGFVVAERVLYAPSLGYCLLVATGLEKLMTLRNCRKVVWFMLFITLICYSVKVIFRNSQWKSDYTLFQSGLQVTKRNAKLWNNVGHSLEADSPDLALLYFEEAAKVQPDDIGSHMNVGRIKKRLGDLIGAEKSYLLAKDLLPRLKKGKKSHAFIDPYHLQLFVHLGNLIKLNESRLVEVDELYQEVLRMRSDFVDGYINRGEILMRMDRLEDAAACYVSALEHSEKKDDLYFNLGVVYSQMGNLSGAVEQYTYAIQENPNHIKALYNSASIFEDTGDPDLLRRAKIRVERILSVDPENRLALSLLGSLHLNAGDDATATKTWLHVLDLQPNDKSALFNMALMYSKTKNKAGKSLKYVEQLLSFHPDHVKGLMLHGDLLLNHKKDTQAALSAFNQAIALDPGNIQARHNYCVVILEEKRLLDAEKCMHDVFLMAPDKKYVAENLAIIRRQIAKNQKQAKERDINFEPENDPVPVQKNEETRVVEKEEDFVYIEPMRKKSAATRAKGILMKARKAADLAILKGEAQSERLEQIQSALKHAHDAVKQLGAINEEMDQSLTEKCPSFQTKVADRKEGKQDPEQTEQLKRKALDALDAIEGNLL